MRKILSSEKELHKAYKEFEKQGDYASAHHLRELAATKYYDGVLDKGHHNYVVARSSEKNRTMNPTGTFMGGFPIYKTNLPKGPEKTAFYKEPAIQGG